MAIGFQEFVKTTSSKLDAEKKPAGTEDVVDAGETETLPTAV